MSSSWSNEINKTLKANEIYNKTLGGDQMLINDILQGVQKLVPSLRGGCG